MRRELEIKGKRIGLYGNKKNIDKMEQVIQKLRYKLTGAEANDRLILQNEALDLVRCDVLYDGNTVYSRKAIVEDFKKMMQNGVESMSDELYSFFHLDCGTIAHYSKNGWIGEYPDISSIKSLFIRNEYGQRVLNHLPGWKTDAQVIVKDIEKLLHIKESEL